MCAGLLTMVAPSKMGETLTRLNLQSAMIDSLLFQNVMSRLILFFFFLLVSSLGAIGRCSDCGRDSMLSLLRSANEPPISLDRLAMLARFRVRSAPALGMELTDTERESKTPRPCGCACCGALVIVDRLLVSDGTSSTDGRNSGPGSPAR